LYKASSLGDIDRLNDDDIGVVCLLLVIGDENDEGFDVGGNGAAVDEAEFGRDNDEDELIWASVLVVTIGVSITTDNDDDDDDTGVSITAIDDDDAIDVSTIIDDETIGVSTIGLVSVKGVTIFPLSPIKSTIRLAEELTSSLDHKGYHKASPKRNASHPSTESLVCVV
jgi:hypothetical protein